MVNITPVVRGILILNFLIYLIQFVKPDLVAYLALYNVNTPFYKPYQLFTYMFVHSGFWHIAMNMLGLVVFGSILEAYWGQNRFMLLYIITGIGAGVFNILMDLYFGLGTFGSMVGASGAVYGVMTASAVNFPNMELRPLFLPFSIKAKYMVMFLGSLTIYSSFIESPGDNTAHLAHLGGILIALVLVQFWRYK